MPLMEQELARRSNGRLELRPEPVRVRWTFDELVTSDQHDARCTFECSVRAVDDATERRLPQEVPPHSPATLLGRGVAELLEGGAREARGGLVGAAAIADLLGDTRRGNIVETL